MNWSHNGAFADIAGISDLDLHAESLEALLMVLEALHKETKTSGLTDQDQCTVVLRLN